MIYAKPKMVIFWSCLIAYSRQWPLEAPYPRLTQSAQMSSPSRW